MARSRNVVDLATIEARREALKAERAHLDEQAKAAEQRLGTLRGLTPYEFICKAWADDPQRFTVNPRHQSTGPNTYGSSQTGSSSRKHLQVRVSTIP